MMSSFSLIMPTYNRKDTISLAIDSVIECNYDKFELIIVDDGSTDGTQQLVSTKYKKYINSGKIKYHYSNGRHGVSFCRNIGLKLSSNEWIGYVDSDNKILPNYFDCFNEGISNNPETKIFFGQYITKSGKIGKSHDYIENSLKAGNYIDLGILIHSKQLYFQYGGFDEKLKRLVDWDLLLTYTEQSHPIFLNSVIMEYNDDERTDRITKAESMSLACTKISLKHTLKIPTVTTIILTYNHEQYLSQAINSAIEQDGYFIHEILISDDCSTDSTKSIIDKYCSEYPELITNISETEHLGISKNYQKCFKKSNGKYIAVLEGDDYWVDRLKLSKQMKYLEDNPDCNLVFSNIMLLRNNCLEYQSLHGKITSDKLHTLDFFKYNLNPIINFSCCMFRDTFVKKLSADVYKYRLSEITLGILCAEYSFVGYIPKIQTVYRVHEKGVWSGLDKMDKVYSAYSVRFVASNCVSKNTKKLIRSYLYANYITDPNFSQFLINKESIEDFDKYLSDNYSYSIKFLSKVIGLFQKLSKYQKKSKITTSDLNIYKNEVIRLAKSEDVRASIILMFLAISNRSDIEIDEMFKEMLNQKHDSKDYMEIARAYRDGNMITKNLEESIRWMTLAADTGNKWARIELISLLMASSNPQDNNKAFNLAIKISLDLNDIHRKDALIRLSRMYSRGIGTPINLNKAAELYLSLLDTEEKIIPEYISLLYANPKLVTYDDIKPLERILGEKGGTNNSKIALILARYYNSIEKMEQSKQYYDLSIQLGNEWAIIEKISFLINDIGNGKDALEICKEYVNKTNIVYLGHAYLRMARIYKGSPGVEPNLLLSKQYYQMAIANGIDVPDKEINLIEDAYDES